MAEVKFEGGNCEGGIVCNGIVSLDECLVGFWKLGTGIV